MADINEHRIRGRLAYDPRIISNEVGSIARLRVMTNYRYQDSSGAWQTRETGHSVIVRGELLELAKLLKKGEAIHVEGYVEEREVVRENVKTFDRYIVAKSLARPLIPQRSAGKQSEDAAGESQPSQGKARRTREESPRSAAQPPPSSNPPERALQPAHAPTSPSDDPFADMDLLVRSRTP